MTPHENRWTRKDGWTIVPGYNDELALEQLRAPARTDSDAGKGVTLLVAIGLLAYWLGHDLARLAEWWGRW